MTKLGLQLANTRAVPARLRQDKPIRAVSPVMPTPYQPQWDTQMDIMPPFGTNPPRGPVTKYEMDLSERAVHADPREAWYLTLPSKLSPKQVLQILRSALGGDLWQSFMLTQLMLDSWPMFRKCCHELRTAVSQVKFVVQAASMDGEEPTELAEEKAKLVARAMEGFMPNPFTDEVEFSGMVYHLTDPIINGMAIEELLWKDPEEYAPGRWQRTPRAATFVHPKNFTFANDGQVIIFDQNFSRRLTEFNPLGLGREATRPDPDKFICGQFVASGSALSSGLMRSLAWYWSAMIFNKEWMLRFAQRYGNPFLDITYKPGLTAEEMTQLENFAKSAGNQNFVLHPEGSIVNVHPAQSLGPDNAQREIKKEADEACQLLLLGQTATSTPTPGKLGNDEQHGKVKREYVEMAAGWTSKNPLKQFARAVVRVNYGDEQDVPNIIPDFTEAADPQKVAQTWSSRMMTGLPFVAEEFYEENSCKMPKPGDLVVVNGMIGHMSDTNEVIPVGPIPMPDEEGRDTGAVGKAVQGATQEELTELKALVVKARNAKHMNGEMEAVRAKIYAINNRIKKIKV